ncbi:hypothetical protein LTR70_004042 [Exophiala xenobiotica]|uniref:Aminotransferase n=1 Tax=Lithohypha guttulata TaxID=1690604 RepID=A0ABR0KEM0_9EURO|nr:hypothetical protein LTR24_003513 [Lithohypha guttulata]KAK5321652.1 hypothetical protein LTR70_004042 [Exophiala xenobiotica]
MTPISSQNGVSVKAEVGKTAQITMEAASDEIADLIIDSNTVMHRSLHDQPLRVVGSEGLYLHLENGQKFLDATGGAAVACLGHNNPVVKKAIIDQLDAVAYTPTIFYSTSAAEELCSLLVRGTNGAMSRAFICSSGSEGNEAAMKMARQYFVELEGPSTRRHRFISRKQSYHGTTLGSLGLGGHVMRRKIYEPMLSPAISRVSPCYAYRGKVQGESAEAYVTRLADELDVEFERVGPENVCAFVAEPVVGAALGCVPSVPGYFAAVRKVCDKYGALLIADEVMSGMGRTGYLHAWQSPFINTAPDLQVIGKGLSGGYQPVAALLASPKVIEVLTKGTGAFSHGQTYQAHPVGCAAATAVQKIVMQPGMMEHVRKMGMALEAGLRKHLVDKWYVGDIRGAGLFWGIEFVQRKEDKTPFEPSQQVAMGVHKLGMQEPWMISLYPGTGSVDGARGDFVLLAPPYTITPEDVELIVQKAAGTIDAYFEGFGVVSEKNGTIEVAQ